MGILLIFGGRSGSLIKVASDGEREERRGKKRGEWSGSVSRSPSEKDEMEQKEGKTCFVSTYLYLHDMSR